MLDVGFFERRKIAALPWRRQLGFIYVLTRAKLQDREGVFASKAVLKVTAGVFRDGVEDWMQTGLLHEASSLCDKCVVAFPGLDDGNVAVHDWHDYQVSRTTAWRIDKGSGETTVEQPRNTGETPMKHPSRARVTRFTVPSSETSTYGVGSGEGAVFAYLAQHGAAIRPDSGFGQRLLRLMDRRGAEAVLATAEAMPGQPLSDRQWVFGLERALEGIPDSKAAEAEAAKAKRDERVLEQMYARRLEWYRDTGKWDPAWGEPPGAAA